eukprot:SAG11_NODE_190_length_12980_cov_11.633802_4_plen_80_part_00
MLRCVRIARAIADSVRGNVFDGNDVVTIEHINEYLKFIKELAGRVAPAQMRAAGASMAALHRYGTFLPILGVRSAHDYQ